ncbi:MAG: CdaR family protein, partial [Dehalococcoidia bacterium]
MAPVLSRFPGLGEGGRAEALDLARDVWRRAMASVRRTPGLLLLSFLLAVSIWVFVTDTENPTVIDTFPQPILVEAVNVGDTLAVARQLPSVDVRISAPADRWADLTAANFRATVDLIDLDARGQEVPVQVEVVGIGGVRVLETIPRAIVVNLEDLVSKTVPVRTRVVGSLPLGYELDSMDPAQSEVTVTGPESLVALVSEAAADVNVTGLTVGVEQTVPLKPLGPGGSQIQGVSIEPASTRVSLAITQSTIVRTVPLTVAVIGTPASGFRVTSVSASPPAVQVQGTLEALQQVDAIALPAVNVNGARSDIARSVAIPIPQGLSFVDTERALITVTIAQIEGSLRTSSAVEFEGLGANLAATLDVDNVVIHLSGPLPVLNALGDGDLT